MTQRELANAAGLGESAFRSYELGERSPKQNTLERIAKALDVAPACFDTYGIEHYDELMHALFLSEEAFSIKPCADGSIRFTDETIQSCVCTWWSWKEFLKEGKYNPFVRHAPVKTTEEVFRFFANGYRREHGAEPEVTGNRKPSERDILSGMGAVSARVDS